MAVINSALFFVFLLGGASAFVYSCNEIKDKLINSNLDESTRFVCLVPQEGYTALTALERIYAQNDKVSTSFVDLINSTCVERQGSGPWRIVADLPVNLDCSMELTLIFTSSSAQIHQMTINSIVVPFSDIAQNVFVAPQTGLWLFPYCHGSPTDKGTVTVYTGAGTGVDEHRYLMASWTCDNVPTTIQCFDNVVTIVYDGCGTGVDFQVEAQLLWPGYYLYLYANGHVAVMSSGRSDNAQILYPERKKAFFRGNLHTAHVKVTSTLQSELDYVTVTFQDDCIHNAWSEKFQNASTTTSGVTNWLTVDYVTNGKQDLWASSDNFVIEITADSAPQCTTQPPPTTILPTTTSKAPSSSADPYCNCALDSKFGMPQGWESTQIWVDVAIILDTSEAMGEVSLVDAGTLIESFIGTDDGDVLITDTKAEFFTRVGLIAMSDKEEVLYNLNMTKTDKVAGKVQVKKGLTQINVDDAFNAALNMFADGLKTIPERVNTRQVIYYMTNSDPKTVSTPMNVFKTSQGIIVVNDFVEEGGAKQPGLKNIASDGYYFSDESNYMTTIQLFCKANCFCRPDLDRTAYSSNISDPAIKASGGCLRAVPTGVPFSKARSNCDNEGGGLLVSVHDEKKASFVNQLMNKAAPKSDYYWIGYSKSDAGWTWEDQSTNPYENWDKKNGEPSQNSISKCTYVDATSKELLWGAGNCNTGFPFACEFAPCEVGNNNC